MRYGRVRRYKKYVSVHPIVMNLQTGKSEVDKDRLIQIPPEYYEEHKKKLERVEKSVCLDA